MNRSLKDLGLALMVVSQFTLLGTAAKAAGHPSPGRPRQISQNVCITISLKKRGHLTFQLPAENSRR